MRVNIERIMALRQELGKINREPIENIDFYENGSKIEIPKEAIEQFKFTGLSNVDFVLCRFWEPALEERLDKNISK